jgi:hypothetical protein
VKEEARLLDSAVFCIPFKEQGQRQIHVARVDALRLPGSVSCFTTGVPNTRQGTWIHSRFFGFALMQVLGIDRFPGLLFEVGEMCGVKMVHDAGSLMDRHAVLSCGSKLRNMNSYQYRAHNAVRNIFLDAVNCCAVNGGSGSGPLDLSLATRPIPLVLDKHGCPAASDHEGIAIGDRDHVRALQNDGPYAVPNGGPSLPSVTAEGQRSHPADMTASRYLNAATAFFDFSICNTTAISYSTKSARNVLSEKTRDKLKLYGDALDLWSRASMFPSLFVVLMASNMGGVSHSFLAHIKAVFSNAVRHLGGRVEFQRIMGVPGPRASMFAGMYPFQAVQLTLRRISCAILSFGAQAMVAHVDALARRSLRDEGRVGIGVAMASAPVVVAPDPTLSIPSVLMVYDHVREPLAPDSGLEFGSHSCAVEGGADVAMISTLSLPSSSGSEDATSGCSIPDVPLFGDVIMPLSDSLQTLINK